MSLLLLTGAAAMFAGAHDAPAARLVAVTLVGLGLACGGASALNHVIDRDVDQLMGSRTRARPVAAGRVPAAQALEFGLALSALSFALLGAAVNVLTAVLALVGNLFYVLVYTRWLKRTSRYNIVIGGAAGAVPPLVGYAAARGRLDLAAALLFAIVFVWTPPHFWALALLLRRHYADAGIPMLPVVAGERETTRQIVAYTVVLVAVTVVPFASTASAWSTSRRHSRSAACSWRSRCGCAERRRRGGQACCSTTRCSTWRCSSAQPRCRRSWASVVRHLRRAGAGAAPAPAWRHRLSCTG